MMQGKYIIIYYIKMNIFDEYIFMHEYNNKNINNLNKRAV